VKISVEELLAWIRQNMESESVFSSPRAAWSVNVLGLVEEMRRLAGLSVTEMAAIWSGLPSQNQEEQDG
jgi:hypothetical protein